MLERRFGKDMFALARCAASALVTVREGWRAGFGEPALTAGELAGVGGQWLSAGLQASVGRLRRIAFVSSADGVGGLAAVRDRFAVSGITAEG
jgi:hypothetical protein